MRPGSAVWFVVLVLILATLVAMLFALATPPPDARCSWVDAEKVSSEKVEALREAGWYPDPTDGKEALYSPSCAARGDVETQALLEKISAGDGIITGSLRHGMARRGKESCTSGRAFAPAVVGGEV